MRHFLSINDITRDEALFLLAEADRLKGELRDPFRRAAQREYLPGKTLAMIFEKPSLRTRVSFDVGITQLGGHPLYLSPSEIGLGKRESVPDVARVLSRICDGIMARVFSHGALEELAEYSAVPVINALSDEEHPCQALADLQTLLENKGLENRTVAYIGDGNNVCNSLMLLCAKVGVKFIAATPEGYEPQSTYVETARREGEVLLTHDPKTAVKNADAIYTDVWTSMGQEAESAKRLQVFPPFQINAELMSAAKSDAIVLHCLPAHRGEEITGEVLESPQSKVFEQAENRLHAQKAVLLWLMG
jgi:ornithine carbamoyltransferase